ncbi:hypothetical protein Tco_0618613 [Tanacetum coccineum]
MSSASSAVTYTSVYTDSEPGRVFWGADEEIFDGGIPRVIVLGYDGLPMYEHVFPAGNAANLPPVDSPTAESLGYISESNPEEDPKEYEDEEEEDGLDEEDEEDDKEEEHLAPADSAIVIPTGEPVSPPEGTEPVIPPSSTDISTIGARITVRLQASISLPPEAEVERILAMTTPSPSPSPPISLSSPPPIPSPLLPSSAVQPSFRTLG